jgi:uncharacterized DUF497 family protein
MDRFVWGEAKNAENIRVRGISFEIVWDNAVFEDDDRFEYGEPRMRAFDRIDGKPYCVVFTPRDAVRIITVRRMHEKEAETHGI